MEQQIDPNTKLEIAAGTDPAFVPGLVGALPVGKTPAGKAAADEEDAGPEDRDEQEPDGSPAEDAIPETGTDDEPDADADADADADGEEAEDGPAEDAPGDDEDGPVFEASDRRGSITANRHGMVFRLDDQEADFRWDEIGAVEIRSPRFGRRFTVTVHMSTNRWFNADVEADARSRLKEWTAELDAVLDAYFEES